MYFQCDGGAPPPLRVCAVAANSYYAAKAESAPWRLEVLYSRPPTVDAADVREMGVNLLFIHLYVERFIALFKYIKHSPIFDLSKEI